MEKGARLPLNTPWAGGGFILWPVDQIYDDAPWESVMVMVERWREIGEYPPNDPAAVY